MNITNFRISPFTFNHPYYIKESKKQNKNCTKLFKKNIESNSLFFTRALKQNWLCNFTPIGIWCKSYSVVTIILFSSPFLFRFISFLSFKYNLFYWSKVSISIFQPWHWNQIWLKINEGRNENFFAELNNLQDIFSNLINQSSLEFESFKFDYFSHDSLTSWRWWWWKKNLGKNKLKVICCKHQFQVCDVHIQTYLAGM